MEKNKVTVLIAGQVFHLSGTEDEAYINSVAAYVNSAIRAVEEKHPALSTNNCTILGALNIADELFKLRQQYEELDHRIDELRQLSSPQRQAVKAPVKRPFEAKAPATTR